MRLKESIDNLLARVDGQVPRDFYERLFESHPDLRDTFAGVDMKRQRLMLVMALQIVSYHHLRPNPAMAAYLEGLGAVHRDHGVRLDDFGKFKQVLLETLQRFHGADWSDALRDDWSQALETAVTTMKTGANAIHSKGNHDWKYD